MRWSTCSRVRRLFGHNVYLSKGLQLLVFCAATYVRQRPHAYGQRASSLLMRWSTCSNQSLVHMHSVDGDDMRGTSDGTRATLDFLRDERAGEALTHRTMYCTRLT